MKYIIMCGGVHPEFEIPKQLYKVNGVSLVERTILLLKEFGIKDIAISCGLDDNNFDNLDVPVIKKKNIYAPDEQDTTKRVGYWVEAFYYTYEPTVYLCGDVWYSKKSLQQIIDTPEKDFIMFGTTTNSDHMIKQWPEPMGFLVTDFDLLKKYCDMFIEYEDNHKFNRKGMSWELYRLIEGFNPNSYKEGPRFVKVQGFASDIDHKGDEKKIEETVNKYNIE